MAVWGLGLLLACGLLMTVSGLAVGVNWRNVGTRAFRFGADNDLLQGFYRRRGQGAFRLWIGGGAAVFGLLLVDAAAMGLSR
jgi:hypothetical protein